MRSMPLTLGKRLMPRTRTLAATLLISLLCATSQAEVRLPSIIGSHMVVQQGMKVPIWGWAEPGERVTVAMRDKTATAVADKTGKWRKNRSRSATDGTSILASACSMKMVFLLRHSAPMTGSGRN